MNKSLLDTDILSEVSKGIHQAVVHNATAYRQVHDFLTLSVISVMEVIQGYQRVGASNRIQAFRNAIASEEVIPFEWRIRCQEPMSGTLMQESRFSVPDTCIPGPSRRRFLGG